METCRLRSLSLSFSPNIPQGTDSRQKSYRQLNANFQAIAKAFFENHVSLSDGNAGVHEPIVLVEQSGDPTTGADQAALFSKAVSSVGQLFFAPNNSQSPIQLTYNGITVDGSDTQFSYVAGPFVFYAGKITAPTDGQLVTLLPSTTLLSVFLNFANPVTYVPSGSNIYTAVPYNLSGNQFNIRISKPGDVYYIAIGK